MATPRGRQVADLQHWIGGRLFVAETEPRIIVTSTVDRQPITSGSMGTDSTVDAAVAWGGVSRLAGLDARRPGHAVYRDRSPVAARIGDFVDMECLEISKLRAEM